VQRRVGLTHRHSWPGSILASDSGGPRFVSCRRDQLSSCFGCVSSVALGDCLTKEVKTTSQTLQLINSAVIPCNLI
jgi:hypothetical protein